MFAADNIRLRALEPEDLEWLYSVENDEELWQWGSSNVPYSRYTLKTYIAESRHDIYADGQLRLVIETEDEHLVLGCVDLMDFSPRHLRAEIGILLFPEYRGRGVATKVLGMLVSYAREHLYMHQLYAIVSGCSFVSEEVLVSKKTGWVFEKSTEVIWLFKIKSLPLHSQSGNRLILLLKVR